jgi:hypothetical protein
MEFKKIDDSQVNLIVESESDKAHRVVRTALSFISIWGDAAVEAFNAIVTPPLEKRRAEWMRNVTEAVNQLIERNQISLDELKNNEQFITTVVQASQIALCNHQVEKLEALRNAVLNSALSNAPEEDLQSMILGMIDIFTQWHLKILKFCDETKGINIDYKPSVEIRTIDPSSNRSKIESRHVSQKSLHLEKAFPLLNSKSQFYMQILLDLSQRGLIERTGNIDTPRADDWFKITLLGKQFIKFITYKHLS